MSFNYSDVENLTLYNNTKHSLDYVLCRGGQSQISNAIIAFAQELSSDRFFQRQIGEIPSINSPIDFDISNERIKLKINGSWKEIKFTATTPKRQMTAVQQKTRALIAKINQIYLGCLSHQIHQPHFCPPSMSGRQGISSIPTFAVPECEMPAQRQQRSSLKQRQTRHPIIRKKLAKYPRTLASRETGTPVQHRNPRADSRGHLAVSSPSRQAHPGQTQALESTLLDHAHPVFSPCLPPARLDPKSANVLLETSIIFVEIASALGGVSLLQEDVRSELSEYMSETQNILTSPKEGNGEVFKKFLYTIHYYLYMMKKSQFIGEPNCDWTIGERLFRGEEVYQASCEPKDIAQAIHMALLQELILTLNTPALTIKALDLYHRLPEKIKHRIEGLVWQNSGVGDSAPIEYGKKAFEHDLSDRRFEGLRIEAISQYLTEMATERGMIYETPHDHA